ncbi:MAG TPA: VWA domain-containing protein [Polyangia bacterium]|nr:VWA domain-containing protein [Polyangia bacterium]
MPTGSGASSGSGSGASGGGGVSGITGVGLTSGGGGDVSPTGAGGSMSCGQASVPVMPEPPDVLIVQDKSASMEDDDSDNGCGNGGCGAKSKWSELTTALSNVITATDTTVNWGLKYFSDNNACDASNAPAVGVAANNGAAVVASIMKTSPGGNTPTRDAITTGATYMMGLTDTNPKFQLLATDGLPNCPSGCATMSRPGNSCTMTDNPNEDMAAEGAVMMAAMQGIPTFVVGIGNVTSAVNTLNQMAINGGHAQTGASTSYYAATDEQALEDALNAIVGVVASCTIPLTNVPANETNVAVSVDSGGKPTEVPQDPNNGWSYTDATMKTIQLNGSYCDGIKNGTYTNVQFLYACPGQTIIIGAVTPG